jgi:hypothetical protein
MTKFLEKYSSKIIPYSLGLILFFFIFSFIAPFLFVLPSKFNLLDFSDSSSVGDTISGLMNPFIGISAAILTFLAFYIQKQANDEIKIQFKDQSDKEYDDFIYHKLSNKLNLINMELNNFYFSISGYKKGNSKRNYQGIVAILEVLKIYLNEVDDFPANNIDKNELDYKLMEIKSIFIFYDTTLDKVNSSLFSHKPQINQYGVELRKDLIDNMIFTYNSKLKFIIENYKDREELTFLHDVFHTINKKVNKIAQKER